MNPNGNFLVYKSSAGSGKTYTLVKEYLIIALGSSTPERYKNILAITFTNKAASEMKDRVTTYLKAFSKPENCAGGEAFASTRWLRLHLLEATKLLPTSATGGHPRSAVRQFHMRYRI